VGLTKGVMAGLLVSTTFIALCSLRVVAFTYSLGMLFVLSPAFPLTLRIVLGTSRGLSCYLRRKKLFLLYQNQSNPTPPPTIN
jgi:hypothetical protein